jgi:hypothetical protein
LEPFLGIRHAALPICLGKIENSVGLVLAAARIADVEVRFNAPAATEGTSTSNPASAITSGVSPA